MYTMVLMPSQVYVNHFQIGHVVFSQFPRECASMEDRHDKYEKGMVAKQKYFDSFTIPLCVLKGVQQLCIKFC